MRILTCIAHEHNWWMVALAAMVCAAGAAVAAPIFGRVLAERGAARCHWCFLAAVTAGAAAWSTHFIAMLGHQAGVPVTFDGMLTIASALIAMDGIGAGIILAGRNAHLSSTVLGGATIGLAISAMHYLGMFAYQVEGVVRWSPLYVIGSLIAACALAILAIHQLKNPGPLARIGPAAALAGAILALHFLGMAAFNVTPVSGVGAGIENAAFVPVAAAIAVAALLILGTGIATHHLEQRTRDESREVLEHATMHDALTGLPNRLSFTETLGAECRKMRDFGRPFALFLIDLDRFKLVNDALGNPAGDIVLQKAGGRLQRAVREGDLVARIAGDEFAVIAFGLEGDEGALDLAERMLEILRRPFVFAGQFTEVGASIGIALGPDHGENAEDLTRHAEVALANAKRSGRDRHTIFQADLMEDLKKRRELEAALRRAVMREEFTVAYQPVIDPRSGKVCAAEALLRWNSPEHGPISPAQFIPIAEELGLIAQIGAGVLTTACRDAASWPQAITLAVNISTVQLLDPRLPQAVARALQASGLAPGRLELEITETALLANDDIALHSLQQLRRIGVSIALDDFGTGYSSLSYLHRFPINRIKIDQSFVKQLPDDRGSASIVKAIVQLGENLNMDVTAEGVETLEQLSFITDQGCDHVQGFLISRPVGHEDICTLLNQGRNHAAFASIAR